MPNRCRFVCVLVLSVAALFAPFIIWHKAARVHHYRYTTRVLIFVTSHFSLEHKSFLKRCWPRMVRNSKLLQNADVLIFATGAIDPQSTKAMQSLFRNVTTKSYTNPGYTEGAQLALDEGVTHGWFDTYDWVIRLNPDVIIRNDTWLSLVLSNPGIDGIFVDCLDGECRTSRGCSSVVIHSDFFAFRPRSVNKTWLLANKHVKGAEPKATALFKPVIDAGRGQWVPGTQQRGSCRVRGGNSPVVHDHQYLDACETDMA